MSRFSDDCFFISSCSSSRIRNGDGHQWSCVVVALISTLLLAASTPALAIHIHDQQQGWEDATATFYGDMDGNETMRMYKP